MGDMLARTTLGQVVFIRFVPLIERASRSFTHIAPGPCRARHRFPYGQILTVPQDNIAERRPATWL